MLTYFCFSFSLSFELVGQEGQIAAQVTKGDDGNPAASEGVVGVVPFRSLGVHPDAGARDQVRKFGLHRPRWVFLLAGLEPALSL